MLALPAGINLTNLPPVVSEVQVLRHADAAAMPPGLYFPRGSAPWDLKEAASKREDLLSTLTNIVRSERFFTAEVRSRAAAALAGVEDGAASEALQFALRDGDVRVRFAAAAAIAAPDARALEVLHEGITSVQHDPVWRSGMGRLLDIEDGAVIAAIKTALAGGSRGGRAEWLELLADRKSKTPAALLPDLTAAFRNPGLNPAERLQCAAALLPDPEAHKFLAARCNLADPWAGIQAARRLLAAESGDEGARKYLHSLITRESPRGAPEGEVLQYRQRRALAAEALLRYGTEAMKQVAAETLVKQLASSAPMTALRAAKILGADRPEAAEWFKGRLKAPDAIDIERNEAALALAQKYAPARAAAVNLLHSDRAALRVRAARALGIECQDAPESLLRLLLVPDLRRFAAPEAALNSMLHKH